MAIYPDGREAFGRELNGLVNFDSYLPYLTDHPDTVPIRPDTQHLANNRFVHQHAYFTEPLYEQWGKATEEKDRRLIAMRRSPYNQIVMRSDMETQMHLDKEECVEPPPEETIDSALKDYFDIDIVGAALAGLQEVGTNPRINEWARRNYVPPPEIELLSKKERRKIFLDAYESSLESLSSPRALSHKFATSALKRTATQLGNTGLTKVADGRLNGETYYPLALPRRGHLRDVGHAILKDSVDLKPVEDARVTIQVLQIPSNRLKSAA